MIDGDGKGCSSSRTLCTRMRREQQDADSRQQDAAPFCTLSSPALCRVFPLAAAVSCFCFSCNSNSNSNHI